MKKEDKEFLAELQNELKTQTTDGNAQPVFWGIVEEYHQIVPDGYGDAEMICDELERFTLSEFIDIVEETINTYDDDEHKNFLSEWEDVDKSDAYAVVDFNNEVLGGNAEVFQYATEDRLSMYTGAFLTKKACKNYIEKYGYNHFKPRTFAMTAVRNHELERLLHILTNINLDDIKEDD